MIYHQERHWRLLSGYCDTGKMAFENLPLGVSSHVSAACTLNAVRCGGGVAVDDKRIRLEVVRLLMHVTRRSIQSLANEVGCTRTHLSLVLNGKRNFTEWMSTSVSRCDSVRHAQEAQELGWFSLDLSQNTHRWLVLLFRYLHRFRLCGCAFACELHDQ